MQGYHDGNLPVIEASPSSITNPSAEGEEDIMSDRPPPYEEVITKEAGAIR